MKNQLMEWTDDRVKAFWDYHSKNQKESSYFTFQVSRHLVEHFNDTIKGASNVLDYGCGKGFFLEYLLSVQTRLKGSGLEFSRDSILATESKCRSKSNFKEVKERDFYIDNNKRFDLITCFEVIEHLNDEILDGVFKDFDKLLEEDGRIIITTPFKEVLEDNMVYCPCCDHSFHKWQHVQSWSKERLTNYAAQYGFVVERIENINLLHKYRRGNLFFTVKKYLKKALGVESAKANNLCCVLKRK